MEETFDINTLDNLLVNSVSVHALWLENLHLTHTSSNELLYHVRSRWQIRWKQGDCIIFSILHSLCRSGMRLDSSFPLIRCMDEPQVSPWKEQNDPDVVRLNADPEVIFACLTAEDDLSLRLFSSGTGTTQGACQPEPLLLCLSPPVTGSCPSLSNPHSFCTHSHVIICY